MRIEELDAGHWGMFPNIELGIQSFSLIFDTF